MSQDAHSEPAFDSVMFAAAAMTDHGAQLVKLIQNVLQTPVKHYTNKDGNLDRELVMQQYAQQSTLLLSLANQLGRSQLAIYAIVCQGISEDYGALMNELADATAAYEAAMDSLHQQVTQGLPVAPEPSPEDEEVPVVPSDLTEPVDSSKNTDENPTDGMSVMQEEDARFQQAVDNAMRPTDEPPEPAIE